MAIEQWQGRWTRHSPNGRWAVYERESGELICELNKRPGGSKDFGDDCGDLIEHAPELYEGCLKAIEFLRLLPLEGTFLAQAKQVCEYIEYAMDVPPPLPGDFRKVTG